MTPKLTEEQVENAAMLAVMIMDWKQVDSFISTSDYSKNIFKIDTFSTNEGPRLIVGYVYPIPESRVVSDKYAYRWRQWNPYGRDWVDLLHAADQRGFFYTLSNGVEKNFVCTVKLYDGKTMSAYVAAQETDLATTICTAFLRFVDEVWGQK